MIHLTRINQMPLVLNADLIQHVESTPDTRITLTSGRNYMVIESPDEVIQRIVEFRQQFQRGTDGRMHATHSAAGVVSGIRNGI